MPSLHPPRDPAWQDYCIYSGRRLPDAALSDEHVIPKSLGGGAATTIRASRALNSRFGSEIDGKIAIDPLVQFGRRDANARGHSRTPPVPRWRGGHASVESALSGARGRYNADFQSRGFPQLYDTVLGKHVPWGAHGDGAMAIPLKIDHNARCLFTLKTLLGVGWRVFGAQLLEAIEVDPIRLRLGVDIVRTVTPGELQITYADPILKPQDEAGRAHLLALEAELVRPAITTMLLSQPGYLEWSIACCGHMVGVVAMPLKKLLVLPDGQVPQRLHLSVGRGGLSYRILDTAGAGMGDEIHRS